MAGGDELGADGELEHVIFLDLATLLAWRFVSLVGQALLFMGIGVPWSKESLIIIMREFGKNLAIKLRVK